MVYSILFSFFVLLFSFTLFSGKENKRVAWLMGILLFLLVALRSVNVGSDTRGYVLFFLNPANGYIGDTRDIEGLFLLWNNFWGSLHLSGQLYLVVCATASVGLVLLSMWKESKNRVWAYTFFLVVFSWYFYLSGIRQGIAMGCFAFGTYLLCRDSDSLSFRKLNVLFKKNNLIALFFLIISPLFHTSALFAIFMLFLVLLLNKIGRPFYIWAIVISFVVCITAVFKDAEIFLQRVFSIVGDNIEIGARYEGYVEDDFMYDTSIYIILKSVLPINFIALVSLALCRRNYDVYERLFFWMVIVSNLFFYFTYMFRLKMYLNPMACIAITNMLWPVIVKKEKNVAVVVFLLLFVVLEAYTNCASLNQMPGFEYHLFFN